MILLLLRVLGEFHIHLKWCQSEWIRVTQLLSCSTLLNLKSGREELHSTWNQAGERCVLFIQRNLWIALHLAKQVLIQITRKASRKSNIDESASIQKYPNGQKMITNCSLVQSKHLFRVHIKQYSHFQRVTTIQK